MEVASCKFFNEISVPLFLILNNALFSLLLSSISLFLSSSFLLLSLISSLPPAPPLLFSFTSFFSFSSFILLFSFSLTFSLGGFPICDCNSRS